MRNDPSLDLLGRFWALHAALLQRDGLEARIRAGETHQELLDRSLCAAEDVLSARSALYHCLMAQGWSPPDTTVRDLAYDEIVLAEDVGVLHG